MRNLTWDSTAKSIRDKLVKETEEKERRVRDNLTDDQKERLKKYGSLSFKSAGAKRKDKVDESVEAPCANPQGKGQDSEQHAEKTAIKSLKAHEKVSKGKAKDCDHKDTGVYARVLSKIKREEEKLDEVSKGKLLKYQDKAAADFDKRYERGEDLDSGKLKKRGDKLYLSGKKLQKGVPGKAKVLATEAEEVNELSDKLKGNYLDKAKARQKANNKYLPADKAEKANKPRIEGIRRALKREDYPTESNWIADILAEKSEKKWEQKAVKHPGVEKAAAKKAGETTHEYMEKHKDDSGTAGKRARLGLTFEKQAAKKKHKD